MDLGGYSATGPRDANEDNYYMRAFPPSVHIDSKIDSFVMVSDGMGGYQGGDVASRLAVEYARQYLDKLIEMASGKLIQLEPDVALAEIANGAHEAILEEIHAHDNASMGATFVGAFVSPTHAWVGHVGDSRAYVVRDGQAIQLTEDHSKVGRMLSRGIITEEQAQNHPDRNRIERALGFDNAKVEFTEVALQPDDALLLCSDGVYTVLDKSEIGSILDLGYGAAETAKRVVDAALTADTDDNSTAVVALRGSRQQRRGKPRSASPTVSMRPVPARAHVPGDRRRNDRDSATTPVKRRRPKQNSSARRKGSLASIIVPSAIFVVLVAAVVVLFVSSRVNVTPANSEMTPNQPAAANNASSAGTTETPSQVEQSTVANGSASSGATGTSSQVEQPTGSSLESYTVLEDAYIRFVDGEGIAHRFTSDSISFDANPTVLVNTVVRAETEERSYGNDEWSYRRLDDAYLIDLEQDCELYKNGTRNFSSRLSRIVESSSYLELLSHLNSGSGQNLSKIKGLLLKAQDLSLLTKDQTAQTSTQPSHTTQRESQEPQAESRESQPSERPTQTESQSSDVYPDPYHNTHAGGPMATS